MKRIIPMIVVACLVFGCDGDNPLPPTSQSNLKAASAANTALVASMGTITKGLGKPGGAVVVSESDPEKILNGLDLLKERLAGTGGRFKTLEATQDNITYAGTNESTDMCGSEPLFIGTITANGSYRETIDDDNNGTPELDETISFTNFSIRITETCNETRTEVISTELVLNGEDTFIDHLDSANTGSAKFTDFKVVFYTKTVNGVKGEEETYAGTISIKTACLVETTYTVSTPLPIFYPDGKDCPVSGKILLIGGGQTTAVIFTSTGGVQIDEGNNGGTPDKTFADCDDADICTA